MGVIEATSDFGPLPRRRFTVEVFDGQDLAAAGWPSIEAGPELAMYVYQSREFLDVWMATIGVARRADCFLVVVKDGGKPILYLPLIIEMRFNNRILRFMDGGVADFNAPILARGHELTRGEFLTIWSELRARLPAFDLIDLKKIASEVCGSRNPLTYLDCHPYESSGHAIALSDRSQENAHAPSVARMHKKLARQSQRLRKLGATRFITRPSSTELRPLIDRLTELKREQYLRTSGRDFFAAPGVFDFYSRMAEPAQLGRISDLSALVCGDNIVSVHLGFIGRGRFYYVVPAFDTQYRPFAVGILLLDHLIECCAQEGYATFDLGEGDFSYKAKWATHRLPLLACEQAVTRIGALFGGLRRVRHLTPVEQLYALRANGRSGLATSAGRGAANHSPSPIRVSRA